MQCSLRQCYWQVHLPCIWPSDLPFRCLEVAFNAFYSQVDSPTTTSYRTTVGSTTTQSSFVFRITKNHVMKVAYDFTTEVEFAPPRPPISFSLTLTPFTSYCATHPSEWNASYFARIINAELHLAKKTDANSSYCEKDKCPITRGRLRASDFFLRRLVSERSRGHSHQQFIQ